MQEIELIFRYTQEQAEEGTDGQTDLVDEMVI